MIEIIKDFTSWLITQGVNQDVAHYVRLAILLGILTILLFVVEFVARKFVVGGVRRVFKLTSNKWDDILVEKKVFIRLAHLFPAMVINWATPFVFDDFQFLIPIIYKLVEVYVVGVFLMVIISFLNALEFYFSNSKKFKDKPIESYFQLVKLIAYFIAGIFILSIAIGKSPIYLLSAFGAMTAIVMLIFKDTILGFVASIQVAANDMLRVDDWLEMPKYGADGDVIKISLTTVKVRNWNKTITTIPTYALVSESFKNWRGMQDTGARRIKRHMYIRPKSIRFVDANMLEKFGCFQLLENYLLSRQKEIEEFNSTSNSNKKETINGRNLTNIGVFRKYVELYLRNNKNVNHDLTLMVRQLQSNQYGLPLEIYCFANTTEWIEYEEIQSDIMDHLLAASESFGLEIYELSNSLEQ
ncbi:MAG: mechanosensitive ion channel [Flavobacteriales bacterium]|nr:mechanosensitive ion channel [Flavobacteriales bacterium]